jgi:hypothetical protein
MQIIVAIVSVVLLIWAEPATAQKTYSVVVSRHIDVPPLSEKEVEKILADASDLLQKSPDHVDKANDVKCNVTFALNGPIHTFDSAPKRPWKRADIEPVHRANSHLDVPDGFHVKIVEGIGFCRNKHGTFNGCSFPPDFRSTIVVHPRKHDAPHVLWAHEFGHLAGLGHRKRTKYSLMKCGGVTKASVRVNKRECSCMLALGGPQACKLPQTPIWC